MTGRPKCPDCGSVLSSRGCSFCALANLAEGCGLPRPVAEHRFSPPRRWRFDAAWPEQRVAVEIEGGVWARGRHTRGAGYIEDMAKYNAAALSGWLLLRFTPEQIASGVPVAVVGLALEMRGHAA